MKEQVTVVFPSTLTFQVAVQDPTYLVVDVQATVFLRQGANARVVRTAIQKALADFFAVSLPAPRLSGARSWSPCTWPTWPLRSPSGVEERRSREPARARSRDGASRSARLARPGVCSVSAREIATWMLVKIGMVTADTARVLATDLGIEPA